MPISDEQLRALLERPSESLQVEVKTWLDTAQPEGIAKLVKGIFAIHNRNGGFFVVGFNDTALLPDPYGLIERVEEAYHVDRIQGIISKYAHDPFPIEVVLGERDGQRHPIILVPDGVQVPTVTKSAILAGGGKRLIAENAVYFRTLNANGTPSSAPILARDFRALMDVCFENREADIGRFLRRQLGGADVAKLLLQLQGHSYPTEVRPSAEVALDAGLERFHDAVARDSSASLEGIRDLLTMEVAMVLDPSRPSDQPTSDFLNTVLSSNPQLTGWPIWLDSRSFSEPSSRPYVKDGGWEALLNSLGGDWTSHFDFMRLEPRGSFYLFRVMQEDLSGKTEPRTIMDPFLMTYRVAEAIAVGLRMARALNWDEQGSAVFAFRWSGLDGRRLSTWANPDRFMLAGGSSRTNSISRRVAVPLTTPQASIAPFVADVMKPLLVSFDGYELPPIAFEDLTQRLLQRRMG